MKINVNAEEVVFDIEDAKLIELENVRLIRLYCYYKRIKIYTIQSKLDNRIYGNYLMRFNNTWYPVDKDNFFHSLNELITKL